MAPSHNESRRFAIVLAALVAATVVTHAPAVSAATSGVAAAAAAEVAAVAIEVRLVAPAGSETELKSALSTEVLALPTPVNQPVPKGAILIEMDLRKLQKEYDGLTRDLTAAQAEKRRLASERGVTSSTPASHSPADLAAAQAVADAQMAESIAMSDLARVQTELATANLRAPANGYLLRQLYAVGAKAKRRKPLLVFVEAQKTVVEAAVPAAQAGPFSVGRAVRITDPGNPALGFRGKILSIDPAGDPVALRIQPLELPFLALDAPAAVSLSAAP